MNNNENNNNQVTNITLEEASNLQNINNTPVEEEIELLDVEVVSTPSTSEVTPAVDGSTVENTLEATPPTNLTVNPIPIPTPTYDRNLSEEYEAGKDEDYLRIFIDNNYDKIINKKFNFAALFLGDFYLVYRKLYLFTFIKLLLTGILFKTGIIAAIVMQVLLGFFFNKIYIEHAEKKIKKFKSIYKSEKEIKTMCITKGGTSLLAVFIYTFGGFIITGIIVALMYFGLLALSKNMGNVSSNITNNTKEIYNLTDFNNSLDINKNIIISDVFTLTVPDSFTNHSSRYNYFYTYKEPTSASNNCEVKLEEITNYDSAEDLIDDMYNYFDSNFRYNANINDLTWYSYSTSTSTGSVSYYATDKNNKVYLLIYTTSGDSTTCDRFSTYLFNNIG